MELPSREPGDEVLPPGELTAIRRRLRKIAPAHDLATVIACAFDHRTRMLPFMFAGVRMAPAGVRTIGSALVEAGFEKTRIVLQQWNRNFRPSRMRLDGRVPDMFLVSSMQINFRACRELIRDAWAIDPARRPLIIAGGPLCVYQPWTVFGTDPHDPWGADVAVTGEVYVLLELLERLLILRAGAEPMRETFGRAARSGLLDDVCGLVYPLTDCEGLPEELVDTGIQRLAGELDELPHPAIGYGLLERPGRGAGLSSRPLPPERVGRFSPIGSLVMTTGCRFGCPYCPIPAYNQGLSRAKSGERIADEMRRLRGSYGIEYFFGADDNFFNDRARAVEIAESLARARLEGEPLGRKVAWATEVTLHDALALAEHMPLMRRSGLRGLWMGVEDMTASLIRKGQSVGKTVEVFRLLRENGIYPMPMMMHHDEQPLYTRGSAYGLINQARLLRKAGAIDFQVLMLTPVVGSRHYSRAYASGLVLAGAGGRPVGPHMFDGNYVIASAAREPWRKQLNMLAAYLWFYNPCRLVAAVARTARDIGLLRAIGLQAMWIYGMAQTVRRTLGWALRLMLGEIKRASAAPVSEVPMRDPAGRAAAHALPGTPLAGTARPVCRRRGRSGGHFAAPAWLNPKGRVKRHG